MPGFFELLNLVRHCCESRGARLPESQWIAIAREIQREHARERVYIPPLDSRKDPHRQAVAKKTAAQLPTGVAAARLNVSRSWAYRLKKK